MSTHRITQNRVQQGLWNALPCPSRDALPRTPPLSLPRREDADVGPRRREVLPHVLGGRTVVDAHGGAACCPTAHVRKHMCKHAEHRSRRRSVAEKEGGGNACGTAHGLLAHRRAHLHHSIHQNCSKHQSPPRCPMRRRSEDDLKYHETTLPINSGVSSTCRSVNCQKPGQNWPTSAKFGRGWPVDM